jgi:hypothetical protein
MRYFITIIIVLATLISATAQTSSKTELLIRNLEQTVVSAILNADTSTLKKVWAPEFFVNNPRNKITGNRDSVLISQKAGMIDYSTFERIIERIQIQKNIVITMGYEIFVSRRDIPEAKAGQTYKRRFTNIWMKKRGKWQQIARHASIICQ